MSTLEFLVDAAKQKAESTKDKKLPNGYKVDFYTIAECILSFEDFKELCDEIADL